MINVGQKLYNSLLKDKTLEMPGKLYHYYSTVFVLYKKNLGKLYHTNYTTAPERTIGCIEEIICNLEGKNKRGEMEQR